ncbi:hypothetical protein F5879DRAFT_920278 [Lentinula edodes]|nr:hypothetical protein F5879DRAFT_920278 [Lentinula edodes]
MQLQFWAKNLASGSATEIVLSRPLHITNISISSEFRNAFAPMSLMISVVLGEQTSPFYTVATLIVGGSSTLQVNVRLDQGVKYVFKVNGPNLLSVLGYHSQDAIDGGASSFRTFARPGLTNRNTGALHGSYGHTGPGSNAAPGIVISPAVSGSNPQPARNSIGSENSNPQTAASSSDQQTSTSAHSGQFNPGASTPRSAPQFNLMSAANAQGAPLYIPQPHTASTGVDYAMKKVKGEDGTPRRQSLAEGPSNGSAISDVSVGPGNNKRKMDFDADRLVPSVTYPRMYNPSPLAAGSSSSHALPATYTMFTSSHVATRSHSNSPGPFQSPATSSAADDGPRTSL